MKYEGKRLTRLERRIVSRAGELIEQFNLIEENDKILVCVSGGKDSYALFDVLAILSLRAPVRFELVGLHLDQGWQGSNAFQVGMWLSEKPFETHVIRRDHASIVDEKLSADKTPCSLCSRMRRGALYDIAVDLGCTKLALGHHLDDAADSLLLNLFFNGRLASLPPWLRSKDERNTVIRPLLAIREAELIEMSELRGYPFVSCSCPFVCASSGERLRMREVIDGIERTHPRVRDSIRKALSNVQPEFLWTDRDDS